RFEACITRRQRRPFEVHGEVELLEVVGHFRQPGAVVEHLLDGLDLLLGRLRHQPATLTSDIGAVGWAVPRINSSIAAGPIASGPAIVPSGLTTVALGTALTP